MTESHARESHARQSEARESHHRRLLVMTVISFVAMYVLMYAMVNTFANVYMNVNQFYMARLMAASMVIIEVALMRAMYHDKRLNAAIILAGFIALAGFWVMIRQQIAVSDRQFLRSMIPHHASAILMCTKTAIRDAEIKSLCQNIVSGQQAEIDQMRTKLEQLAK